MRPFLSLFIRFLHDMREYERQRYLIFIYRVNTWTIKAVSKVSSKVPDSANISAKSNITHVSQFLTHCFHFEHPEIAHKKGVKFNYFWFWQNLAFFRVEGSPRLKILFHVKETSAYSDTFAASVSIHEQSLYRLGSSG